MEMESPPKSTMKPIHVNLVTNMLAMSPYETDPRKHYATISKQSFRPINPVANKNLNKISHITPDNQSDLIHRLSRARTAPAGSNRTAGRKNDEVKVKRIAPEDYLKLEQYRTQKYAHISRAKELWR
jgi:hypothetical protein